MERRRKYSSWMQSSSTNFTRSCRRHVVIGTYQPLLQTVSPCVRGLPIHSFHRGLNEKQYQLGDRDQQAWSPTSEVIEELLLHAPAPAIESSPEVPCTPPSNEGEVVRNYDAVKDSDGVVTVWLIPSYPNSSLGKRNRQQLENSNGTTPREVLSDQEGGVKYRCLPPRAARTIAQGRNRQIPNYVKRSRKKRPRSPKETSPPKSNKKKSRLSIADNPFVLKSDSYTNLLPFFDDYDEFFPDHNEAPSTERRALPTRSTNKPTSTLSDDDVFSFPSSRVQMAAEGWLNFPRKKIYRSRSSVGSSGVPGPADTYPPPFVPWKEESKLFTRLLRPTSRLLPRVPKPLDFCLSIPITLDDESFP